MSHQLFFHGKLLGVNDFLLAPTGLEDRTAVFQGRSHWVTLLAEVLPRALLNDLGLSKILLGSSGGGQFLVVLPEESKAAAIGFLAAAADYVRRFSGGRLNLVWAVTENLGDWSDVRKRLAEEMRRLCGTPLAATGWMETESSGSPDDAYFAEVLGPALRDAAAIAWNPDRDQRIVPGEGKYAWALAAHGDGIALARHTALDDSGSGAASMDLLAARATGRKAWGVLRGDVDNFGVRIRRLTTIEEHIQISIMYKQFFAGEIEVLASMPEFWQRVSVLYTGGDDFAVYGSWDALIPFARELQRLFHRFAEENLKDFPGAEGKTITMAIALASGGESLAMVHEEAGQRLNAAKSSDKDSLWLLGRLIEWKQFGDASDLKDALTRMVTEHGLSPHYLREVCAIYRESQHRMSRRQARRTGERPWRYYRRIQRILTAAQEKEQSKGTAAREREFAKDCGSLIGSLVGHRGGYLKLRPAGRVALEWARLSTEG